MVLALLKTTITARRTHCETIIESHKFCNYVNIKTESNEQNGMDESTPVSVECRSLTTIQFEHIFVLVFFIHFGTPVNIYIHRAADG